MELLHSVNISSRLKSSIQEIVVSNDISLDSPWHDYEVLNAALKQGNKDVANELLAMSCTVNKDVKSIEPSDTPLHNAVKLGDVQLVKKLLEKDASITAVDSHANTALHLAFILKHYEIVDLVLLHIEETSSYEDSFNKDGISHLHIACARGNAQLVYSYEYVGADIKSVVSKTSQEYPGYTCLQFACDTKCQDVIQVVSKAIKLLGDCSDKKKYWFGNMEYCCNWSRNAIDLHHVGFPYGNEKKNSLSEFQSACFNGFIDEIENFIAKGEDMNSIMTGDALACALFTPLHFAVEANSDRQKIVEILLANGANVNLKNGFCMTPLHSALYSDPYRRAKVSYDTDPEQKDTLKVIYEAVEDKESNPMDPFGLTYFHVAVSVNDLKTVKKFIETGQADYKPILPNSRNFSMWTPLHFAAKYGHEDMAELLIQRGANVNANEHQNPFDTPLQVAIKFGQCRMVEFLLARGANARVVAYDEGKTTLHLLVKRFGDYEDEKPELLRLVDSFIRCGVDVNSPDSCQFTPLHNACWKIEKASEIVDELLKQGADINAVNKHDSVPFDGTDHKYSEATPEVLLGLYYHVQKLKHLGLKVDSKNDEFCERIIKEKEEWKKSDDWSSIEKMCSEEELTRRQQEWIQEIEKLKADMLNENVSLYDYLKMEAKEAVDFIKNERIEKLVADEQLRRVYAAYGYLIPVVHRKSLRWIEPQQPAKEEKIQDPPISHVVKLTPPVFRQKKVVIASQGNDQQLPANISLHDAIKIGNIKWVKELLAKGVFLKTIDEKKNGPLHLAFTLNHEKIVDLLLSRIEEKSEFSNFPNDQGLTQLHIAASRGKTSLVQKLLDAGANPSDFVHENSPKYAEYTALQFACDSKHLETAKVLTKAMKVYGNVPDNIEEKFAEMTDMLKDGTFGNFIMTLFRNEEELSEFHEICYSSKKTAADVSQFLDSHVVDVNAPMTQNSKNFPLYTALHFAVESDEDKHKKVEILLKHGADVNRKNGLGMTPLHLACYRDTKKDIIRNPYEKRQKDETLEILYNAAKDKEANPMDAFGLTYFHIAVARDDLMLVKRMIFHGEDVNRVVLPNARDFSNYTPLHFAARYGRAEMAKVLIERGAKVRDDDDTPRFYTPLQVAIIHGKCDVMEILLEHGANTKVVPPKSKKTTLHLMADRYNDTSSRTTEGRDEKENLCWFVERLVKGGADVDAKDSEGFTALQSSCANLIESSGMVRWLLWMGADINIKVKGKTALDYANDSYFKYNFDHFFMLYEHVQKLKDLGLKVDPRNEKFCQELLENREIWIKRGEEDEYYDHWGSWEEGQYGDEGLAKQKEERQEEIRSLQKDMLTDEVSMYDYIRMDGKKATQFLGNERLRKIDGIVEGQRLYEIFGYLIPVVYRRSQKWLEEQKRPKKVARVKKSVAKAQSVKRKRS